MRIAGQIAIRLLYVVIGIGIGKRVKEREYELVTAPAEA